MEQFLIKLLSLSISLSLSLSLSLSAQNLHHVAAVASVNGSSSLQVHPRARGQVA